MLPGVALAAAFQAVQAAQAAEAALDDVSVPSEAAGVDPPACDAVDGADLGQGCPVAGLVVALSACALQPAKGAHALQVNHPRSGRRSIAASFVPC